MENEISSEAYNATETISGPRRLCNRFCSPIFECSWYYIEIFEISTILIFGIVHFGIFTAYLNYSIVQNDTVRYPIIETLSFLCPLASLYYILTFKLKTCLLSLRIISKTSKIVAPLAILLWLVFSSIRNQIRLFTVCIFLLCSLLGIDAYLLIRKSYLIKNLGLFFGGIVSICLLMFFNIYFSAAVSIALVTEEFTNSPASLIKYTSVFYLIVLILLWGLIHQSVFKKQPFKTEELSDFIQKMKNPSLTVQTLLMQNPDLLEISSTSFISKNSHLISSGIILVAIIATEIGIIISISIKEQPSQSFSISVFYIVFIPIFMFLGTLFSSSNLRKTDKFFVILILVALFPTAFVMWLGYSLSLEPDTHYLGILIGVGFPVSLVYWLVMIIIYDYNIRIYQYVSAFCFVFVLLPVGIIWPLYSSGGMLTETFEAVIGSLCCIGFVIFAYWLFLIIRGFNKSLLILIEELNPFSSFDCTQFVYSVCFLLGFALLAWMGFKRLSYQSDEIVGVVFGCLAIFGILIITSLIVHQVNFYQHENDDTELPSFKDLIFRTLPSPSDLQITFNKKRKKYQVLIMAIGTIIVCIISVPLIAFSNSVTAQTAGVVIIIGSIIALLIILLLIQIKGALQHLGKKFISYTLGACWIFCFIPFICLIPISLASAQTESDVRSATSWSIGLILMIIMFSVSAGSISINHLLRRLDYEKIAKSCCMKVQSILIDHGVNTSLIVIRSIYDNYKLLGKGDVEKILQEGKIFYFLPVEDSEPDLRFSKIILKSNEVSRKTLARRKKREKEKEEEEMIKEKGVSLIKCCKNTCIVKTEADVQPEAHESEEDYDSNEEQKEENKGIDQQVQEIVQPIIPIMEKPEVPVLEITQDNAMNIMNQLEANLLQEKSVDVKDVQAITVTKDKKKKILSSRYFKLVCVSEEIKNKWLRICYSKFASRSEDGRKLGMTLSDLRQFMRLSNLQQKISYARCDLLFTQLTKIYNEATSTISTEKLVFKSFLTGLLPELSKLRYPKLPYDKALECMFREDIFPNIATNLPMLYQDDPDEMEDVSIVDSLDEEKLEEENPNDKTNLEIQQSMPIQEITQSSPQKPRKKRLTCKEKTSKVLKKCCKGFLICLSKSLTLCQLCLMPTSEDDDNRLKLNDKSNNEQIFDRRESPEWDEICRITIEAIENEDKSARGNTIRENPKMQRNFSNVLAIIGHVSEIYSFTAIAFSEEVGWKFNENFTRINGYVIAESAHWLEVYAFCLGCCVLFSICVFPAIRFIKQGRFGMNSDMTIARFPSTQFFLAKAIGFLGKTMYFTIMSSLLGTFSCVYMDNQWRLMRVSDIVCFEGMHIAYFGFAIIALFLYYPFSTLLYPNITFQNRSLDLQFDTGFLVIESQGKLVIAAFAAFFAKETYIWLQLIVCITVTIVLFTICVITKPCLVSEYNRWKAAGFLVPAWVCACGLFNYYTQLTYVAIAFIAVGLIGLIGTLLYIQYKKQKKRRSSIDSNIPFAEVVTLNPNENNWAQFK